MVMSLTEVAGEKRKYAVRLLEFMPGTMLISVPMTSQLTYDVGQFAARLAEICLLYTSPSPRDFCRSRMPSSA